jgi:hypothetical protein
MSYPACFDSEEQYAEWNRAADSVYHYGARQRVSYCSDCTPMYARRMRKEGRCEHKEVRFYRFENAYMGIHSLGQAGRIDALNGEDWELVHEPDGVEEHA